MNCIHESNREWWRDRLGDVALILFAAAVFYVIWGIGAALERIGSEPGAGASDSGVTTIQEAVK